MSDGCDRQGCPCGAPWGKCEGSCHRDIGRARVAVTRRQEREARLSALGFEDVSTEQRVRNIALTVALMDWPK